MSHFYDNGRAYPAGSLITIPGADEENDHSWHFTASTATTGDMTKGYCIVGGEEQSITESSAAVVNGTGVWEITISSSHTHFWLEVDVSSPSYIIKSGSSWPSAPGDFDVDTTEIFRLIEFTDSGDTSTCIERLQSDVRLPRMSE